MNQIVGRRFHMLMWDRGESQTRLGREMGLAQSPLSRKLRGVNDFDLNEILWLCDHFGVTIEWITRPPTAEEGIGGPDDDGDNRRARRDSNPQPSDLESQRLATVTKLDPNRQRRVKQRPFESGNDQTFRTGSGVRIAELSS